MSERMVRREDWESSCPSSPYYEGEELPDVELTDEQWEELWAELDK